MPNYRAILAHVLVLVWIAARSAGLPQAANNQYSEARSGRAANDLTCQQHEPEFRGESWTTKDGKSRQTKRSQSQRDCVIQPSGATS